jgi:hypothetical protein
MKFRRSGADTDLQKMNQPPSVESQEIPLLPLNLKGRTSVTKDLAFRQLRAQAHV